MRAIYVRRLLRYNADESLDGKCSGEYAVSDEVRRLINRSEGMAYGVERLAVAEEAVREADALNDLKLSYEARMSLTDAANFCGSPDKLIVAFSWCLAKFDSNPHEFDGFDIMWRYKWIVTSLPEFPDVSLQQITKMMTDLARRYEAFGYGQRVVHLKRMQIAMSTGNAEEAIDHYEHMDELPRDYMSDCDACECNSEVHLLAERGMLDDAIDTAKPLFSGQLTCAEVPHVTYGHLLDPLLLAGRVEDAKRFHKEGYPRVSRYPKKFLGPNAEHLMHLGFTSEFVKGIRAFERGFPVAADSTRVLDRLRFYLGGLALFRNLANQKTRTRKVRLPNDHVLKNDADKYHPHEIADWLEKECFAVAKRFDDRNRNTHYTCRVQSVCDRLEKSQA